MSRRTQFLVVADGFIVGRWEQYEVSYWLAETGLNFHTDFISTEGETFTGGWYLKAACLPLPFLWVSNSNLLGNVRSLDLVRCGVD